MKEMLLCYVLCIVWYILVTRTKLVLVKGGTGEIRFYHPISFTDIKNRCLDF